MRWQSTKAAVWVNLWTLEIRDVQRILALVLSLKLTYRVASDSFSRLDKIRYLFSPTSLLLFLQKQEEPHQMLSSVLIFPEICCNHSHCEQVGEWCTLCCSSYRVKVYLPEGTSGRETQFSLSGLWSLHSSCGILCINIKVRDANEWAGSAGAHLVIQVTAVMS